MPIKIQKTLGQYYPYSYENFWRVEISGLPKDCPDCRIWEDWSEEKAPEIDGMLPSEVADLIEDRIGSIPFHAKRNAKMEVIQWIKAHRDAIDRAWAEQEIEKAKRQIARLQEKIELLEQTYILEIERT